MADELHVLIHRIYKQLPKQRQYRFVDFIVNVILVSGEVRSSFLSTCSSIDLEWTALKRDYPTLFHRFCDELEVVSFVYLNSTLCIVYKRGTGMADPMKEVLGLSDRARRLRQIGRDASDVQGELDRVIGVILGYHCARPIHQAPPDVSFSVNVSFPHESKRFLIIAYGCTDKDRYTYYTRRILYMHFRIKTYFQSIGLRLLLTTEIRDIEHNGKQCIK